MPYYFHSKRVVRAGVVIAGAILFGGCNLDLSGLSAVSGQLLSISFTGPSTVQVGDTIRLTATGAPDGLIGWMLIDPLRDARFTASDPTVATILAYTPPAGDTTHYASVRVQGRKVGTLNITVSARGKSATHPVDVVAAGQ